MESNKNKLEHDIQKQKEFVFDYLRKNNLVSISDNVISAPKAFMINAVLRRSITQMQLKKMSQNQWNKTRTLIAQYLAGVVDLKWVKGKIKSIEVPYGET